MWTKKLGVFPHEKDAFGTYGQWSVEYKNFDKELFIKKIRVFGFKGCDFINVEVSSTQTFNPSNIPYDHFGSSMFFNKYFEKGEIFTYSTDKKFIAYFLAKILLLQPDLAESVDEICTSLNFKLSDAYTTLPPWIIDNSPSQNKDVVVYRSTKIEPLIESVQIHAMSPDDVQIVFDLRFPAHADILFKHIVDNPPDFTFDLKKLMVLRSVELSTKEQIEELSQFLTLIEKTETHLSTLHDTLLETVKNIWPQPVQSAPSLLQYASNFIGAVTSNNNNGPAQEHKKGCCVM